tara:strand:- start:5584 stop:7527 length:1944 start_codon:yes stop_codon:yes gene_type:complete
MNGIGDAGGIMGGVGFNPEENEDAELYVPVDEDTLASRQILKRELAKIGRQNKVNLLTDDQVKALINQVNAGNLITAAQVDALPVSSSQVPPVLDDSSFNPNSVFDGPVVGAGTVNTAPLFDTTFDPTLVTDQNNGDQGNTTMPTYEQSEIDSVMARVNSGELSAGDLVLMYPEAGLNEAEIQANIDAYNAASGTGVAGSVNTGSNVSIAGPRTGGFAGPVRDGTGVVGDQTLVVGDGTGVVNDGTGVVGEGTGVVGEGTGVVNGGAPVYTPPTYTAPTYTAPTYNAPSSGGDSDHIITTRAEPPAYLQPFLNESVNYSRGALGALGDTLGRPNALISPFNPVQLESMNKAAAFARDPRGDLVQSQDVLREISDDADIRELAVRGQNLIESGAGRERLGQFENTAAGNQIGINALEGTAAGNSLYGGPGFNEAVAASMRAAQPIIASTFSKAGSGGLKSGLAQIGMQQAASDAFARQYGQERGNQLNAANSLNSLALSNRGMQTDAAGRLLSADQQAGNTQLQLANADRARQMQAAQLLPQYGLMGSDILGSIGGQQQSQDTAQRQAGVDQYQKLMDFSFGNFNPTSLMGQSQSQPVYQNRGAGLLGGAMTGANLGSQVGGLFGGSGDKWGAGIGGLLGGAAGGGYF